jgi:hypothetical protein
MTCSLNYYYRELLSLFRHYVYPSLNTQAPRLARAWVTLRSNSGTTAFLGENARLFQREESTPLRDHGFILGSDWSPEPTLSSIEISEFTVRKRQTKKLPSRNIRLDHSLDKRSDQDSTIPLSRQYRQRILCAEAGTFSYNKLWQPKNITFRQVD